MNLVNGTQFQAKQNTVYQKNGAHPNSVDMRDKVRMLNRTTPQNNKNTVVNSVLQSSQSYAEQIRAQRQNAQKTALSIKKIKYQFKNLSSRIISSKTSIAAKQAAGQARREVLRLKNEKLKGGEDNSELDAAIAHAKAMERVAKKKAKHLEEEERVKVGDGYSIDQIEADDEAFEKAVDNDEMEEAEALEEFEEEQLSAELEAEQQAIEQQVSEALTELISDLTDEMQELMDEMSLDEMMLMETAPGEELDPEELKDLKIKHRNKEMKELVQADAEYLKAVFDSLEKSQAVDSNPVSVGATVNMASQVMDIPSVAVSMPQPVIDVSL